MLAAKILIAPMLAVATVVMAIAALFDSPWWWAGVVAAVAVGLFICFADEPAPSEETLEKRTRWPANDG